MIRIFKNTWLVLELKERKKFSLLIIADIFISLADILSLAALLWIIRFYIQPEAHTPKFLPDLFNDKHSIYLILLFLILFSLINFLAYLVAKSYYTFAAGVSVRITTQNLSHYQNSSFHEFTSIDSSQHIRKISLQPFEFSQYILAGVQQMITQICLISIAALAIIVYKPILFVLLFCLLVPPLLVVFFYNHKQLKKIKYRIKDSNEKSFQYLLDALKGYVESNIDNKKGFFLNRYISERKDFSKHLFESVSLQNMPPRFIEVFAVLGLFILIAIAQWTGHTDSDTLIMIGAFMAAAYKIIPGVVKIINLSGQMKTHEYVLNEISENILRNQVQPGQTKKNISSLEFNNISYSFGEKSILSNLTFKLEKGDFAGISGISGKGKTTLLNLLLGFYLPTEGEIRINGNLEKGESLESYWSSLSYTRQQTFLIHDTIAKNISLEENYDPDKLQSAVEAAGLENFLRSLKEGVNAIITENGKNISGGQQQRIALARAFYKDAEVIILDEPFNQLDDESTNKILDHLNRLSKKGKIILLVTHDKKNFSYCNKSIVLNE